MFRRVAGASLRYLGVTPSARRTAKIAAVEREGDPADATLAMMRPPTQPAAPPTPAPGAPAPAGSGAAAATRGSAVRVVLEPAS